MPVTIIIGAQLGDEGKGKVVDLYAEQADIVVRFNGGANAGHTLVANGKKIITHLIPSGVMHDHVTCVLGNGMVIDPIELMNEIKTLKSNGFLLNDDRIKISDQAHLVLPYHKEIDARREGKSNVIGTTKKGIGPAYESKMGRRGIRMIDAMDHQLLKERIIKNYQEFGFKHQLTLNETMELYSGVIEFPWLSELTESIQYLSKYFIDATSFLNEAIDNNKKIIIEGAQAALLDIDHGQYPYVSSSSATAGGACASLGIGPNKIDTVIGVAKVYTTAVGNMVLPTEMNEHVSEVWREAGGEFGSTTGRARRIGWLDIPAIKKAAQINGMDYIAWVKLDVFLQQKEKYICTSYLNNEPVLEDVSYIKDHAELISKIEYLTDISTCLYSFGPDRKETVVKVTV